MAGTKETPKVKTGVKHGLGGKSAKMLQPRTPGTAGQPVGPAIAKTNLLKTNPQAYVKQQGDYLSDELKKRGLGHLRVRVESSNPDESIEKTISSILKQIDSDPAEFFRQELDEIAVVDDKGGEDINNNMELGTLGPTTLAYAGTKPNWGQPGQKPRTTALVVMHTRVKNASQEELDGMLAHEIGHIKEKMFADSLFMDYLVGTTGNRLMGDTVFKGKDVPELSEMAQRLANDPRWAAQKAFVQAWENVSLFKTKEVEANETDSNFQPTGKTVKIRSWVFAPGESAGLSPSDNHYEIIKAAFNFGPTPGGADYAARYAESKQPGRFDSQGRYVRSGNMAGDLSPTEELAEAIRVSKEPGLQQHLENLGRTNPKAKQYLEGLLKVINEYQELVKNQSFGKLAGRSAPAAPVKRGRGRPPGSKNKPKTVEPVKTPRQEVSEIAKVRRVRKKDDKEEIPF